MNTWITLVRREFWEHRALWMVPLLIAALMIGGSIVGSIQISSERLSTPSLLTPDQARGLFAVITTGISLPFAIAGLILIFFYLLDTLYSERKDRSILFWKSMPISDHKTVAAKAAVALLVVPLGIFVLSAIVHAAIAGIYVARFADSAVPPIDMWDTPTWFGVQAVMLIVLLAGILWFTPLVGYLMLVSAWAKRAVFLWAVLPPLALMWIESVFLDSRYFAEFLGYRLVGYMELLFAPSADLAMRIDGERGLERVPTAGQLFESLDLVGYLTSAGLWLGLIAAAGLFYAAIRLRRYRDDT